MKRSVLFVLMIIGGGCLAGFAQRSVDLSQVDQLEKELDRKIAPDEPGAAIIVYHQNKKVFEKYYGLADLERKEKLTANHVMGIASMSKQFEGMAVLQLVADGKLILSDDILKYLPDLPLQGKQITIKQLLTHTSGLPELTQNDRFMNHLDQKRTVKEIIDVAFTGDFRHEPGVKYQYCNTGYSIVVALIEKLTGMNYSDYLHEKIFQPLQMDDTYSCDYMHDATNAVPRYTPDSTGYSPAEKMHFSNLIGGGGVVSNVRDLARWNLALQSGNHLPSNYMEMWNPAILNSGESTNYGLGMGISETNGHRFYYHPGMGSGMNAVNMIFPDHDLSVTVIRNVSKPRFTSVDMALLTATYLIDGVQ